MDGNFSTEHLGRIIKALRGERRMTQKELAERLSVTPSTVSKWENGVVAPDVFMLRDMAEVFEVSLSDLTGKERTEAGREEEAETDTPPENCAEIHSSPETAPKKNKKDIHSADNRNPVGSACGSRTDMVFQRVSEDFAGMGRGRIPDRVG